MSFRLSLFRSQRKVWFNLTLLNTHISCLFFIQDHCCILYSIIGWNCSIGMWSRVEGSRCDPNPNEEFSRPDGESLFGEDGKLTPSITILGRRKKDFWSQFRNIHGDIESSSIAFSRASRTLPGFLLFFTLSRLWLLVREKFSIDRGEQSGVGLVCFVSLSELSRKLAHFLDQSDSKVKSIADCHSRFPALWALTWFLFEISLAPLIFPFVLIGCCDDFGFDVTPLNWNAFYFETFNWKLLWSCYFWRRLWFEVAQWKNILKILYS